MGKISKNAGQKHDVQFGEKKRELNFQARKVKKTAMIIKDISTVKKEPCT